MVRTFQHYGNAGPLWTYFYDSMNDAVYPYIIQVVLHTLTSFKSVCLQILICTQRFSMQIGKLKFYSHRLQLVHCRSIVRTHVVLHTFLDERWAFCYQRCGDGVLTIQSVVSVFKNHGDAHIC
jgi:hypothetical protein